MQLNINEAKLALRVFPWVLLCLFSFCLRLLLSWFFYITVKEL